MTTISFLKRVGKKWLEIDYEEYNYLIDVVQTEACYIIVRAVKSRPSASTVQCNIMFTYLKGHIRYI